MYLDLFLNFVTASGLSLNCAHLCSKVILRLHCWATLVSKYCEKQLCLHWNKGVRNSVLIPLALVNSVCFVLLRCLCQGNSGIFVQYYLLQITNSRCVGNFFFLSLIYFRANESLLWRVICVAYRKKHVVERFGKEKVLDWIIVNRQYVRCPWWGAHALLFSCPGSGSW